MNNVFENGNGMYMKILKSQSGRYFHLQVMMLSGSYQIINETDKSIILYFPDTRTYVIECDGNQSLALWLAHKVWELNPEIVQTTNSTIYNSIYSRMQGREVTYVYGPYKDKVGGNHLEPVRRKDFEYVFNNYPLNFLNAYVQGLLERERVLGYYEEDELVGWVSQDIDFSLNGLYVKPKYRRQGYGKRILQEAVGYLRGEGYLYSYVPSRLKAVKSLLSNMSVKVSPNKVFWSFRGGYHF